MHSCTNPDCNILNVYWGTRCLEKEAVEKSEIHICVPFFCKFCGLQDKQKGHNAYISKLVITQRHVYYRELYLCAQRKESDLKGSSQIHT